MAERRGGGPNGEPSGDPPATGAPPDESPAIGETVVEPSQDVPSTIAPRSLISNTYRVEALIATGGMGEVYRARNVEMDTLHAVKTIKPELAGDQRIIDLFRREAKVLRDLRSDVIVGNDGVIRDEADRVYLVMEYIEGESLSAVLERGPLPPADVRRLRDRLAKGLAAAHDNDVIHRDMSPDNVILQHGRLDRAKIIDFGIAKLVNPGAVTVLGAEFAGKYAFASPEQLDPAESTVDARSDIYSLGLVLAAMAAGKPLDMGTSLTSVVESRKTVPDLSAVPSELHDELAAMLQPDPADRPQSMRDLLTPDQDEGPKWRLMAAAAIAAAVAVAIAVDVFWPRPPDRPAIGDAIDTHAEAANERQAAVDAGLENPYERQVGRTATQGFILFLMPYGNKLEEFPAEVCELTHLNQLRIPKHGFDEVPEAIGKLTALKYLDLSGNKIERFPDSIGKLTNLKTLKVKDNPLLPGELERLKTLLPGCKIKS